MTDTTVNWRTLSVGRALDRIVAERLGWTDIVVLSDGSWHGCDSSGERDELPAFSKSADAALTLFATLPDDCTPRLVRMLQPMGDHMGYVWKGCIIVDDHNFPMNVIEYEADTPALAICRAWLAWKDGER